MLPYYVRFQIRSIELSSICLHLTLLNRGSGWFVPCMLANWWGVLRYMLLLLLLLFYYYYYGYYYTTITTTLYY